MKDETSRKQVTALAAGDIIDPPSGEKCWLWSDGVKRRYTVLSIEEGKLTKRGAYVRINATFSSPYDAEKTSTTHCQMIATKTVTVR